MIHYNNNIAVGQETCLFIMQWQVTILLYSRVASLTDRNLYDVLINCSNKKIFHVKSNRNYINYSHFYHENMTHEHGRIYQ